jgi:hypothetical protein
MVRASARMTGWLATMRCGATIVLHHPSLAILKLRGHLDRPPARPLRCGAQKERTPRRLNARGSEDYDSRETSGMGTASRVKPKGGASGDGEAVRSP